LNFVFIIYSHLRLGLPSEIFPSAFLTKIICAFLSSPIRVTCCSIATYLIWTPTYCLAKQSVIQVKGNFSVGYNTSVRGSMPWHRIHPEKLIVAQLRKKFSAFYFTIKKACHLTLSSASSVHCTPPNTFSLKSIFNIILPFLLRRRKRSRYCRLCV